MPRPKPEPRPTGPNALITIDDVRRLALAQPDAEEHTHYWLPAFQVGGKTFVVVKPNQSKVLVHVDKTEGQALADESPLVFEQERPGRPYGIWCDLTAITIERLTQLIRSAYLANTTRTTADRSPA
jgi:hypothetical protein